MNRLTSVMAFAAVTTSPVYSQVYVATETEELISARDLETLVTVLATNFRRYDFEIPHDYCLYVSMEVDSGAEDALATPFARLCGLAGPQRLMLVRRADGDVVRIMAHIRRREDGRGGTVWKDVALPGPSLGGSSSGIPAPAFELGVPTIVADFSYSTAAQGDQRLRTNVKVYAELERNPEGQLLFQGLTAR